MRQHSTGPAAEAGSPQEGCGHGPRRGFWHHGPRGPHGHHGPHGHGFGPFGRARRGNVRAAVLSVLVDRPMHGYEIMQELQERSGGAWRPSPGSVYPTLQLLEDQGLVKGEDVEGKRVFSLTDEGKAEADAVKARAGEAPWESGAGDDPRFKLRQAVFQVAGAAKQVGAGGTAEQVQAALDILNETRRRIYQLLADGE
jgi:DNA-binding PadR family transcriptional regulator